MKSLSTLSDGSTWVGTTAGVTGVAGPLSAGGGAGGASFGGAGCTSRLEPAEGRAAYLGPRADPAVCTEWRGVITAPEASFLASLRAFSSTLALASAASCASMTELRPKPP